MAAADNSLILTFEQSTVYTSDLRTLNDGTWLNDTIIGFAYDIFANKIYAKAPKNCVLFVHPTTVNVIKCENDEEDLIPLINDSGIPYYDYIFLPINNSQSFVSVSGSHWALLIYQRHNNTFYYLDSAGSYNLTYAKKMANKIYPKINMKQKEKDAKQEREDVDDEEKGIHYTKVLDNFVKLEVPQQENVYDCGMYVVEFTRFVAKYYLDNNKQNKDKQMQFPCVSKAPFFNKENTFDSDYMIQSRKEWKKIIHDMGKEKQN